VAVSACRACAGGAGKGRRPNYAASKSNDAGSSKARPNAHSPSQAEPAKDVEGDHRDIGWLGSCPTPSSPFTLDTSASV